MVRLAGVGALAFPIILSNLSVPLLGAVDTAIMGHMETAAYLAAVAIGALIFDYIYWGFGFLRLSTTGLASQALGAQDGSEARHIFARALIVALIFGLVLWMIQLPIFQLAKGLFNAEDQAETLARLYFDVRIWAAPAALANYVLIGWILAFKDTKGVLIQQVLMNVTNTVLSLWFVLGLDAAIEGVAAASVIAQYVGLICGLVLVRGHLKKLGGRLNWADVFQAHALKKFFSMNADLMIRTVCLLSAFAWFANQGASQGTVILAANAILLQFLTFSAHALDGFAHAIEILSGHAKGAKDKPAFKAAFQASVIWSFGFAAFFSLLFVLFGSPLIGFFSDLPDVLEIAHLYLVWMMVMPIVAVWSYLLDGIYFGLTETRILRNMMVVSLLLFIASSSLLVPIWGNHGLWAAFTFFMSLRAITLGLRFPLAYKRAFAKT